MLIKNNNYCFAWLLIFMATPLMGADSSGGDKSPRSEFVSKVVLLKQNSLTMKAEDQQKLMRFSGLSLIQDDRVPSPFKALKKEFKEANNNLFRACLVPRITRDPNPEECLAMQKAHQSLSEILKRIVETALKVDMSELKKV